MRAHIEGGAGQRKLRALPELLSEAGRARPPPEPAPAEGKAALGPPAGDHGGSLAGGSSGLRPKLGGD
jgi:hypothetical protein